MRIMCAVSALAAHSLTLAFSTPIVAAERGLSSYLPAYYGDYGVAVAPKSGFYNYATYYRFDAKLDSQSADFDLSADALIVGFQFVVSEKLAGLTFATGAYSAFVDADLQVSSPGSLSGTGTRWHKSQLGDTSISPIIIYWSSGNWHFNIYEAIFLPTGRFVEADVLNISRNYYSLDTVASVTWLDISSGVELSLVPGLMYNFENATTKYQTGIEFHLDAMLNFYLSKTFAVGFHSYYYDQISNDQISGQPIEGGVDSRAVASGVSFLWLPSELGIDGKVVGKWLHDIETRNRFHGDILSVTAALKF